MIRAGNAEVTVLASAARTANTNSPDLRNLYGRGVVIVINVTAKGSAPSVVFTVKGKSSLDGAYYTILASAAITNTGTTVLRIYPGLTAAGNLVASDVLPAVWRVEGVAGNSDSLTYSISANYVG